MISSSFSNKPIGPPIAASGPTCPMTKPTEPPEKRPSVIKPTIIFFSLHRAVILEVESNISGIPGPPTGPSYLTIIISKFLNFSGVLSKAFNRLCSPSKILALPLNTLFSNPPSTPANFKTALNSGERFPPNTLKPPPGIEGVNTEDKPPETTKTKPSVTPKLPEVPKINIPPEAQIVEIPFTDIEVPMPTTTIMTTAATTAFISVGATLTATSLFKYLVMVFKPIFKTTWNKITKKKQDSSSLSSSAGQQDS